MKDYSGTVKSNSAIAENIYMLTLTLTEAAEIKGGQFVNLETGDGSQLLRRPLGVCKVEGKDISVCYQVKGAGTKKVDRSAGGANLKGFTASRQRF